MSWAKVSSASLPNSSRFYSSFRRDLLAWYGRVGRDLPWRREGADFYRVWISEIMLQQTRVEAVIPYFDRFLSLFPDVASLAAAPEPAVLAAWSGLGYYSRARNLHRAAKQVVSDGTPTNHAALLSLPGIGAYTAGAIASIALNLPHAAVDGNVLRVVSRLLNDAGEISSPVTRKRFGAETEQLLDPVRPGDFNQALMDLGASICVPRKPLCGECPVARYCAARAAGTERELPVKLKKKEPDERVLELALFRRDDSVYLVQRAAGERRMAGFWELPLAGLFPGWRGRAPEEFTHHIVNDRFRITVRQGRTPKQLPPGEWVPLSALRDIPLSTIARKSLERAGLSKPASSEDCSA